MKLNVNEIFYSLQGEGGRVGEASIFIRLSKCNLSCSFCDTDFEEGVDMTLEQLESEISQYPCKWIIWTGGEPTLQLTDASLLFFKEKGYKQAVESNGTKPISDLFDYITCSPKIKYEKVSSIISRVDEIRIPVKVGDMLPPIDILPKAVKYYISPIFDGDVPNEDNINYCIELVKQNPAWSLSLQMHKLIHIE